MKRIEELFVIAELLLPAFIKANEKELGGRVGLALAIIPRAEIDFNTIKYGVNTRPVGVIEPDKFTEKSNFAHNKILYLFASGDMCSFQKESESTVIYGGGICTENYLIAPSGFPPHLDQKFALALANMAGDISYSKCIKIESVSRDRVESWKKKTA